MKKALIIGIGGQDGFYLSQFLRQKNYAIGGMVREASDVGAPYLGLPTDELSLFQGDLLEQETILSALNKFNPDEVYNLGAHSIVADAWGNPERSSNVNALGVARVLEAVRLFDPRVRYYQASSSEMFGYASDGLRNEESVLYPSNPYAISKAFAHQLTIAYREHYGMFACSGILFNHESPKRSTAYVSRHVTKGVAAIKLGIEQELAIGNLHAKRDWGDARDYVRAMWLMLQQDQPGDYVIGSGQARSVKDLVECAFRSADIRDWERLVVVKRDLCRTNDDGHIVADASKARRILGWQPEIAFEKTIEDMIKNDINELGRECREKET